ncbi:MAG: RIP metalloprotease RseP [Gemmatimonadales bacterium]
MLTLVSLIVVLGVLVFVHEAGHFLAAKWAGIYVHRFSLGLGAPIRRLTFRKGETEYSISWLPLGGYVKMASREEEATSSALEGGAPEVPVPPDRVFEAKPVWKRMIVILAGVTMNAVFAWFLYTFLAAKNGRQIDPVTTVGRVVDSLLPPEAQAFRQIRPGTRIDSLNGKAVTSWDDVVQGIANTSAEEIRLSLGDGSVVTAPIHPDAIEQRLKTAQALEPYRVPVVGQVVPGRPAARAGVQAGDTIKAIDGRPVSQWYDLLDVLERNGARPIGLEVARAAGRQQLRITPYIDSIEGANGQRQPIARIGVALGGDFRSEPLTIGQAAVEGCHATIGASTQIVRTVRGLFSGRISKREVGGPILIGQLAGESARLGLDAFLSFMALISINLAVLNLLPVPVLDGGQFLFLVAEAVVRRPLPLKLRERLTMVGLVLIVMLMGLAFSNDLRRVFGG